VVGVEMSIEGGLSAPRGGTLRWILTAYEVRGLSELRPAPDATVHVATSLEQTADAAEVRTDAFGRAMVELPIPEDAPNSFRAVLRLVHSNGIQRRYDLTVSVRTVTALDVRMARRTLRAGGPARTFGRLFARDTGVGLGGQTVRLTLRDQGRRPMASAVEVTTDPAGLFAHTFTLPDDAAGAVFVEARTSDEEHPVSVNAQATVGLPGHPALLVSVAPEHWQVRPGSRQYVDVVVRNPQGRPLPGTVVTLDGAPRDASGSNATTDARGRARLSWRAAASSSGIHDVRIGVTANREGWGSGHGVATVRVAADSHAFSMSVEGGQLAPSLGGRVYVRVVNADGRPASAGVEVRLAGPRLPGAGVTARTDDSGVATLDVTFPNGANATADRCGGETATAIEVRVGSTQLDTCLGLDPDAAARVRVSASVVRAGGSVVVEVDRTSSAARLPVELTVLSPRGPTAVASGLIAGNERRATLTLPEDTGGLVFVRARPLFGSTREVVRGGITGIWVVSSDPATVNAELAASGEVSIGLGGVQTQSAYVVAAPIDEARALADALRQASIGPLGDLRTPLGSASDALLQAAIAAQVPSDDAAPAVLRGRRVISSPAPSNPTQSGLLRDPWRSRARFITGRLALIVRALERHVATSVPERTDDVAVQGARGFTFNASILESLAQGNQLGSAGATGLGGDPLTIEQLQRFDRTLTYDNVARRLTRERLFRLILALRHFVTRNGFDLPWSRLGDPSEWMRQLQNQHAPGIGRISRQHLVDGWGRPFELRATRGGRSRFSFVDPLGSWEIVSSGPDGRFGSGDDLFDPTRRILRSGTPYAEAVGEDILVARLEGVELGRASIQLLRSVEPRANAGGVPGQASAPARARAQQLWNRLPTVLSPPLDALGLRRPAHPGDGAGGLLQRFSGANGGVALSFDEEPRTWGAVVWSWTDGGFGSVALSSTLAGSPLIIEAALPTFLRTNEAVDLDVILTNVTEATLPLRASASAEGIELRVPDELTLPPGEATSFVLHMAPDATPGRSRASLRFVGPQDEQVREVRWGVRRVDGSHPQRVRAAGLAHGRPFRVRWTNPEDAHFVGGRVVVLAPSALGADPDLADLRERDPALIAFSDALAARASDPELWARLLRRQRGDGLVEGQNSMLSTACAAVAWASAGRYDHDARAALTRLSRGLANVGNATGRDPAPDGIRSAAAALGALAAGGVPELHDRGRLASDPVSRVAAVLRVALRRTIRNYPEEPTLLARAAAALLLADPRDAYGLAMLEAAQAHLITASDGGARVDPSERMHTELESLSATAALAVAAHQAGRVRLAERLLRGALAREHVATRAGGESAFWLLSAGAFGAYGEEAASVVVQIDGRRAVVELTSGRGVVELDASGSSHEVVVESPQGAAFVRVEASAGRDFIAQQGGPFELALNGDVGDAITGSGLELSVRATEELTEPSVLVIQLPAGVQADDRMRAMLSGVNGVTRVEAREPAFVRLWLAPMNDGTELTIPLAFRWTVRGELSGLGAIAFSLSRPEAMSVLAPRQLSVPSVTR